MAPKRGFRVPGRRLALNTTSALPARSENIPRSSSNNRSMPPRAPLPGGVTTKTCRGRAVARSAVGDTDSEVGATELLNGLFIVGGRVGARRSVRGRNHASKIRGDLPDDRALLSYVAMALGLSPSARYRRSCRSKQTVDEVRDIGMAPIQNSADEFTAGVLDEGLRLANDLRPIAFGLDHQHDTVHSLRR